MQNHPQALLRRSTRLAISRALSFLAILALLVMTWPVPMAHAATLTKIKDTLSTVTASTIANHTIQFVTPTGVQETADTIILTFESFTMGSFALLNFDLAVDADANCDGAWTEKTLATSAAAGTWGVGQASQVVTFTPPTDAASGEITAGVCVQIEIGSNATQGGGGAAQITNPAAGNYDLDFTGNFGDTGAASVSIIADESVNVTSTVDEYITFTITDTTIGYGALDSTAARWATGDLAGSATDSAAAHTMTLATNAGTGYAVTYNGATLTSGSNTIDVAAITNDADGTAGSEQFAMGFSTNGDATVATGYDHNATPASRDWTFVASTTTTVLSEIVPTATETFSAFYLANISGTTQPGTYTTNVTYIATGTF